MKFKLIEAIQSIYQLDDNLVHLLTEKTEKFEYPARFKIVKSNSIISEIFFIEKGAARSYFYNDGNEITTWFSFENEFVTSFYSFISNQPSHETIELLEDSIIHSINFNDLNTLTLKYPPINHLYRKVLEINFLKQERILSERYYTAKDKYDNLMQKHPEVLQRVPLGYIASYLGINQSTLSRIRKK